MHVALDPLCFRILGTLLDDRTYCRVTRTERMLWDQSAPERQWRKGEQRLTARLRGKAECHVDCEGVALLLQFSDTAPFLSNCFWDDDLEAPFEVTLHIEFCCIRRNLSLLQSAIRTFLQDLRHIEDLHVLRETMTFSDEFTGIRLYDNGQHYRSDIPRRLFRKASALMVDQ